MTMSLFRELNRRNIFRVAVLYVVLGWLLIELGVIATSLLDLPSWMLRFGTALLVICFPLALVFSWIYEITPEGLKRESEVDPKASITRQTARRLNVLTWIAAGLIVLLNIARVAMS